MLVFAEQLAILLKTQNVRVRIDSCLIQLIVGQQRISYLVAGIAEHQNDLLATHRNTLQVDCEAVTGKDREDHADGLASGLCLHVSSDILN